MGNCHTGRLRQVMPLLGHTLADKFPLQRASSPNYGPVNVPGYERIISVITKTMKMGLVKHRAV